jgi:hypothetical protein
VSAIVATPVVLLFGCDSDEGAYVAEFLEDALASAGQAPCLQHCDSRDFADLSVADAVILAYRCAALIESGQEEAREVECADGVNSGPEGVDSGPAVVLLVNVPKVSSLISHVHSAMEDGQIPYAILSPLSTQVDSASVGEILKEVCGRYEAEHRLKAPLQTHPTQWDPTAVKVGTRLGFDVL